MKNIFLKFIFIEFVLFSERFFRSFKNFWKEKEIVFGKWLCKRYGNWEDFAKSYSPKMKCEVEQWSQILSRWDFHIPYRMAVSNSRITFSYPEAQPKKQNALINALWKIDGIEYIEISAYKIHLTIGTLFQFEDLKPKIFWVIEKYAPEANF
ncbi:MAG: hypothetical protein IAE62_00035 [Flavobacteriales bacterium]|nr:hypothetical protein [Flavobacteriales bacterium]